jgi:hypothetical protein
MSIDSSESHAYPIGSDTGGGEADAIVAVIAGDMDREED